jgi:CubicO group peptidase (beta-lactamase class C family)
MSRSHSNIAVVVLSLLLIACHSTNQPAVAAYTKKAMLPEMPFGSAAPNLVYDSTSPEAREIISKLDNFYRRQVQAGFNGSVLIGYKGKIVYERYFGYANRERKVPLDANASGQLASVSKTFTSGAILYLYDHKLINLDAPVQTYLPEFPYPNITIRMLLDHRSGLPDYTKWVPVYNDDTRTPITNEQMIALMVKHKPHLESKPNTRFKYCNTNFAVLARVIEKVTDMPYSEFMERYMFRPLGMRHTFVYDPFKGLPPNATISYKHNWIREPDMFADGVQGDKGIYSTVEDMYRWDQSLYTNRLLKTETIDLAYGPCSFEKKGIKNYGLGWRMLCYPNGSKIIYHNGWWHGNNTSFYRFIKDNLTIVVLGNRFTNSIYHQAPVVYSIVKNVPVENGFDVED